MRVGLLSKYLLHGFGLSCVRLGHNSASSQQHAGSSFLEKCSVRTIAKMVLAFSLTCELNYQARTKSDEVLGHKSDSSQQHARTGGVKLSLTCELNYQIRTKVGEVMGHDSDSSQQHARTVPGGAKLFLTCELNCQVRTKSGEVKAKWEEEGGRSEWEGP